LTCGLAMCTKTNLCGSICHLGNLPNKQKDGKGVRILYPLLERQGILPIHQALICDGCIFICIVFAVFSVCFVNSVDFRSHLGKVNQHFFKKLRTSKSWKINLTFIFKNLFEISTLQSKFIDEI